jgi:hypothetical protein
VDGEWLVGWYSRTRAAVREVGGLSTPAARYPLTMVPTGWPATARSIAPSWV